MRRGEEYRHGTSACGVTNKRRPLRESQNLSQNRVQSQGCSWLTLVGRHPTCVRGRIESQYFVRVELAKRLGPLGVDLIDCSSGGAVLEQQIPIHPGYQVPLAQAVREGAEIKSAAVGLISEPVQAEEILANERADLIVIGRMALWSPYWPHHAASALHAEMKLPIQYARSGIYSY